MPCTASAQFAALPNTSPGKRKRFLITTVADGYRLKEKTSSDVPPSHKFHWRYLTHTMRCGRRFTGTFTLLPDAA
jgi:hypothetical protein